MSRLFFDPGHIFLGSHIEFHGLEDIPEAAEISYFKLHLQTDKLAMYRDLLKLCLLWPGIVYAQGSLCVLINPDSICPLSDRQKQDQVVEASVNHDALAEGAVDDQSGDSVNAGISASLSKNYAVYALVKCHLEPLLSNHITDA